ncbi:MAG: NAD(P)-binding domain-containing protein, partial [Octadecabacter sp.]
MKIAFIGLGNMGAPMAANLIKAGHDVAGFDVAASPDGITMAASIAHACDGADVAITMLPNGAILRNVGKDVIAALPLGAVFIDCSTVDVDSARAVGADASAAGLGMLDAP